MAAPAATHEIKSVLGDMSGLDDSGAAVNNYGLFDLLRVYPAILPDAMFRISRVRLAPPCDRVDRVASFVGERTWRIGWRRMVLNIPLAVLNASTLIHAEELRAVNAALQVQVSRDFAPAWNVDAQLTLVDPGEIPPHGCWWIVLLDNSDLGAALGYHDLTSEGLPMAKVFVETAKRTGQEWSVLFSHEVLEMLADPYINLTALIPSSHGTLVCAYENCDACQSDRHGYLVDGTLLSNFCLPSWFDGSKFGSRQRFDFGGLMSQPFELLPGGYAMVSNLAYGTGWQLVTSPGTPKAYRMRPRVGSRRERRNTNIVNWHRSVDQVAANTVYAPAGA